MKSRIVLCYNIIKLIYLLTYTNWFIFLTDMPKTKGMQKQCKHLTPFGVTAITQQYTKHTIVVSHSNLMSS